MSVHRFFRLNRVISIFKLLSFGIREVFVCFCEVDPADSRFWLAQYASIQFDNIEQGHDELCLFSLSLKQWLLGIIGK